MIKKKDISPRENSPTEETEEKKPENSSSGITINDWPELKNIPIQDLFAEGWKPRVKSKPDGKRYISIRHKWKEEETGEWSEQEKGLGVYDPERWELLLSLCPQKSGFPRAYHPRSPKESSLLKTTLTRPKAIPTSVPVDSDLIEYYLYFQGKGYGGDLGEWMKECIRNYLIGNGLELAVVIRSDGEKN